MYLFQTIDSREQMTTPRPFGPGFTPEQAAAATKCEVWATSFTDPGPDYCEFRLLDANGQQIATRRVDGY